MDGTQDTLGSSTLSEFCLNDDTFPPDKGPYQRGGEEHRVPGLVFESYNKYYLPDKSTILQLRNTN